MSLYIDINKELSSFNLDVSMESKGGIIGFLGASGSGKSMTLKCIAGIEKADSGKIIINDKVLFDSEKKINVKTKDRKVGFLFQNYALFPHMTIKDNIEIGLDRISKAEKNKLSSNFIKKFGLEGLEKRYPWQLSGGQQQRVALARALITSPDILLLDEPFSALDNHLRATMERELVEILKDYNGTVVFVTHDIAEAYRVCDKIIVFDSGKASNIREKNLLFENPLSFAEAKLTGCKNISKAKKLEDNLILAEDWDLKLKCSSNNRDTDYIAIRSHNIKLFKGQENDENVFTIRRNRIRDVNEIANAIVLLRKENISNRNEFDGKVQEALNKKDELINTIKELENKNSKFNQVSKYLITYNNYKEIYEKHGNKKTIFGGYKKHENEILMFLHAKEKLENLGINTNVSIDKLKEKIIEQKEEISLLGNEFKNIEKRLESIRKANSKIENIIQEKIDLTKEKEKER